MPDDEPVESGDAYSFTSFFSDPEVVADLERGYLNVEVFRNPTLDQIYRTLLRQTTLHYSNRAPDEANVIYAQINGKTLPFALRESLFWMHVRSSKLAEVMQTYGVTTFDGLRTALFNDPDFPRVDREMGLFFVRHFPKLLRSLYDILAVISATNALVATRSSHETAFLVSSLSWIHSVL